jgi:hypothetical protein
MLKYLMALTLEVLVKLAVKKLSCAGAKLIQSQSKLAKNCKIDAAMAF